MNCRALLAVLITVGLTVQAHVASSAKSTTVVQFSRGGCGEGLQKLGGGPFGVLTACEDALGNYITVVYVSAMGAPKVGAWSIGDRCWFDKTWGADVTSFAWDSTGRVLFVATSGTYGSGSVYALNLMDKKSRNLAARSGSTEEEVFFDITDVDIVSRRIEVRRHAGNTVKTLRLSF